MPAGLQHSSPSTLPLLPRRPRPYSGFFIRTVIVAHRDFRRYVLLMKPLRTHDRYDYVPLRGRPDYSWPGGRRLAVYFALNLEHFSFGEGLGAELSPGGPQPDVLNFAWRAYGNP